VDQDPSDNVTTRYLLTASGQTAQDSTANAGRLQQATPFSASPSPVPATGSNLFTFMAARLSASFTNLGCGAFGLKNTVTLTQDTQGVATAATFSLVPQAPNQPGTNPSTPPFPVIPTPSQQTPWTPWTPWTDPGYGG
jgi:hypothetical protein